jgi:hypothetical protein
MGLSYVKSSVTLGDHRDYSERVRMPQVSLGQSSMNCIDAAVMYASLFENLGMDAKVIIVPGHAYVGVRVAQGSPKFLLIDGALTGRVSFAAAVLSAEDGMARRAGFRHPDHDSRSALRRHLPHALKKSSATYPGKRAQTP